MSKISRSFRLYQAQKLEEKIKITLQKVAPEYPTASLKEKEIREIRKEVEKGKLLFIFPEELDVINNWNKKQRYPIGFGVKRMFSAVYANSEAHRYAFDGCISSISSHCLDEEFKHLFKRLADISPHRKAEIEKFRETCEKFYKINFLTL